MALFLGLPLRPVTGFALTATILVDIFAPMYILLNIACLMYFLRFRREEFNLVRHGILPVLGAVAFIPGVLRRRRHPGVQLHQHAGQARVVRRSGRGGLDGDRHRLLSCSAPETRQRILETKRVFDEE